MACFIGTEGFITPPHFCNAIKFGPFINIDTLYLYTKLQLSRVYNTLDMGE